MRPRSCFVPVLALLGAASLASAQVPAGSEFRVNTQTLNRQTDASAAMAPNGDFVVTWTNRISYTQYDVHGQRYDSAGGPLGGEFLVNSYTTGIQRRARVAMRRDGSFVVAWMSLQGQDGLWAKRFDRNGAPLGAEFRVDATGPGATAPAVAMDRAGNFVVAWSNAAPLDPDVGVFARLVSSQGVPLAAEFRVNTHTTFHQVMPSAAMAPGGDFVIVWTSNLQDGSAEGIFGQRFDANGVRQGGEFQVNTTTGSTQRTAKVARDASGNFVVAWESFFQDGDVFGIFAQRFAATGARIGGEFAVNTYTTGNQFVHDVRTAEAGTFMVTWTSEAQDGDYGGAFAQRFHIDGQKRGAEFRVNAYTTSQQFSATLAHDPAGNFTVAWESAGQDGSDSGIFAQRYGGLFPAALRLGGGNVVLEPGESADVRTSWRNDTGSAQPVTGTLTAYAGPLPGGLPSVVDGSGSYGTIADGATMECADCYGLVIADPSPRPAVHWEAVAMERLEPDAQGQDKLWSLHVGRSFLDVPPANPFYRFIETLLHHDVTSGCSVPGPGQANYCPSTGTTRAQMAVFVLVAKEGPGFLPPACTTPMFPDIQPLDAFCRWIEELARRGVVAGCGNGNYCPYLFVTREQMSVFVVKTLDPTLSPPACGAPVFADVSASNPFCRWIEELARRGIVTGCGGGNYCPLQPVTREQMGVFIVVTFGLTLYGV